MHPFTSSSSKATGEGMRESEGAIADDLNAAIRCGWKAVDLKITARRK